MNFFASSCQHTSMYPQVRCPPVSVDYHYYPDICLCSLLHRTECSRFREAGIIACTSEEPVVSGSWKLMTPSAEWSSRIGHTAIAMPDGSILMMGGISGDERNSVLHNDTWRSTDYGKSWTLINARSGLGSPGEPDRPSYYLMVLLC